MLPSFGLLNTNHIKIKYIKYRRGSYDKKYIFFSAYKNKVSHIKFVKEFNYVSLTSNIWSKEE
jgi:hypothetical protein